MVDSFFMFPTNDPRLFDAFVNHPEIRGTIEQGEERISTEERLSQPDAHGYACPVGVCLFFDEGDGVYALHGGFLKKGRGGKALAYTKSAVDDVFGQKQVRKVVARVPYQLPAARLFCRMLGFKSTGLDSEGTVEEFVMEKDQWAV